MCAMEIDELCSDFQEKFELSEELNGTRESFKSLLCCNHRPIEKVDLHEDIIKVPFEPVPISLVSHNSSRVERFISNEDELARKDMRVKKFVKHLGTEEVMKLSPDATKFKFQEMPHNSLICSVTCEKVLDLSNTSKNVTFFQKSRKTRNEPYKCSQDRNVGELREFLYKRINDDNAAYLRKLNVQSFFNTISKPKQQNRNHCPVLPMKRPLLPLPLFRHHLRRNAICDLKSKPNAETLSEKSLPTIAEETESISDSQKQKFPNPQNMLHLRSPLTSPFIFTIGKSEPGGLREIHNGITEDIFSLSNEKCEPDKRVLPDREVFYSRSHLYRARFSARNKQCFGHCVSREVQTSHSSKSLLEKKREFLQKAIARLIELNKEKNTNDTLEETYKMFNKFHL